MSGGDTAPSGTRLIVQHHGNMHMDGRRMAAVPSWFQRAGDRAPKDRWVPCPCFTFVIRHKAGIVLFDLGCPADWAARWQPTGIADMVPYDEWTPAQGFEAMLAGHGLAASDIDLVVLSHLHMDHCGNLALFERTRADILLQKAEFDGAMGLAAPGSGGYVTSQYQDLAVKWRLVDGDLDLMAGIKILSLPGHCYGPQGLSVRLARSGLFVLASDAAQVAPNLGPPAIAGSNLYDSVAWRQSVARLRRLRDEEGATIVFGHEPAQLRELRLSPDYYA